MSTEQNLCSWCRCSLSSIYAKPRRFVWNDVSACSDDCETALGWLLDGVPMEEVLRKFPR